MTRLAGGNTEGATVEVIIGNVFGVFVTPLLLEMFLSERTGWGFGQPRAEGGQGVTAIYKQMGKQLALTLVLPLVSGRLSTVLAPHLKSQVSTADRWTTGAERLAEADAPDPYKVPLRQGGAGLAPPSDLVSLLQSFQLESVRPPHTSSHRLCSLRQPGRLHPHHRSHPSGRETPRSESIQGRPEDAVLQGRRRSHVFLHIRKG